MKFALTGIALLCYLIPCPCQGQTQTDADRIINLPSKLFSRIQAKTSSLDEQLTKQTQRYLEQMSRREAKLQKKLHRSDPAAAQRLFSGTQEQYQQFAHKIVSDTIAHGYVPLNGEYRPYLDSLQSSLSFLQNNPQLVYGLSPRDPAQAGALRGSVDQLQCLEAQMQDAAEVQTFMQQRKAAIGDYLRQHADLQKALGSGYQGMNQEVYYYSQQLRGYKEMLNKPDELEQKALSLLNQLPDFQKFMKNNAQLGSLFSLPAGYSSPTSVAGLQTRDQVGQLVQGQLAAGGAGASASLESNLQSASEQLDQYKAKLNKLGSGNGDIDMPNFKPNSQKIKRFWNRVDFGTNLQTTRTNYYWPTITDLAVSMGYKLTDKSTIGLGASYKIGWGTGIHHIALSSQGAGLRSFCDIGLKGSFSVTGGLEYNYITPINSVQQLKVFSNWTRSGLIGMSKSVSVKNRFFKQTKLQLLWDFLSYQQVPKTQPLLFRVGYNF